MRFRSSPGCTTSTYSSRSNESADADDDEADDADDADDADEDCDDESGRLTGNPLMLLNFDFNSSAPSIRLFRNVTAFRPTSSLNGMMNNLKMKMGKASAASTMRAYLKRSAIVMPAVA